MNPARAFHPVDALVYALEPTEHDDKYSRGVVGFLTGSAQYPGAAVLGVEAAARAGAGLVRFLGPEGVSMLVLARRPETVCAQGRVDVWVMGSGVADAGEDPGRHYELVQQLAAVADTDVPVILDAGAIGLAHHSGRSSILTPHAGELARLMSTGTRIVSRAEIQDRPQWWAERAAERFSCTVILKGHTTFVAHSGMTTLAVEARSSWAATAGSGDVLAGILGALVAQQLKRFPRSREEHAERLFGCCAAAVSIHAQAAERASRGAPIVALDIAEALPDTIRALRGRDQ